MILPGLTGAIASTPQLVVVFLASATSATHQIVIPATARAGDFAVLVDLGSSIGEPTNVVPTNWTQIQTEGDGSTTRITTSGKILVAGDAGSTITGINASDDQKVMLVFRGAQPFNTFTPSTWNEQVTGGNPSQQTVSAAGVATPVLVIGAAGEADDGPVAFSVATPAFDALVDVGAPDLRVGYKIYNGGPADHSIDMADIGNGNALVSGYVILT